MAIPVATEIEGVTTSAEAATATSNTPPSGFTSCSNRSSQVNVRAAAEANYLSCCRSSPLALRKRKKREVTESSPASSISGKPACRSARSHPGGSSVVPVPSSSQTTSEADTEIRPMESPPCQASGRQRRDGGRPSGKRSGKNIRISPGAQIHSANHDAPSPNGSEPARVTRA
jgi:hypothetical protein